MAANGLPKISLKQEGLVGSPSTDSEAKPTASQFFLLKNWVWPESSQEQSSLAAYTRESGKQTAMRPALVHTDRPRSGAFGPAASRGSGNGLSAEEPRGQGRVHTRQEDTAPGAPGRHGHTQTGL